MPIYPPSEMDLGDRDGPTSHVILSAAKDLCTRRVRPFPFAEFTLERSEGLRAAAPALRRDHRRHAAWRPLWSPWKISLSERLWSRPYIWYDRVIVR